MGEFAYIEWLRERTPVRNRVLIGPGDDCAAIQFRESQPALITTDMLMEGKHFVLEKVAPRAVGRKAMAANLSDMAAMAGTPIGAVVSVALPVNPNAKQGQDTVHLAEELYLGLREMADEFDTAVVGGDTNAWAGPLVISITLFGEASEQGAIRRSGAQPGDWLMVTGSLGGSILGKHLDFKPRVREAQSLTQFAKIHALIDLSDGLAGDLQHICQESKCGAVLYSEKIPISRDARKLSQRDGQSALEHALNDGEDFELLFAVAPAEGNRLLAEQPIAGIQLTYVGECVREGLWLERNGQRQSLTPRSFEHEF